VAYAYCSKEGRGKKYISDQYLCRLFTSGQNIQIRGG